MHISSFLTDLMRLRNRLPSQLAADLGVTNATVHRWLSGKDAPSLRSCRRIAEYSGVPLQQILVSAGHLEEFNEEDPYHWPELREYARQKYPDEMDNHLITAIEGLIERRRQRRT